jgi:hypothetical protein
VICAVHLRAMHRHTIIELTGVLPALSCLGLGFHAPMSAKWLIRRS